MRHQRIHSISFPFLSLPTKPVGRGDRWGVCWACVGCVLCLCCDSGLQGRFPVARGAVLIMPHEMRCLSWRSAAAEEKIHDFLCVFPWATPTDKGDRPPKRMVFLERRSVDNPSQPLRNSTALSGFRPRFHDIRPVPAEPASATSSMCDW